jgi:AcrR family transcriptional regulator
MGTAERKAKEKLTMRRLILQAAMKLFVREGYENISLRHIAKKIDYSPATIYLYFKDKNEILHALHTAGFEMLYERQKTVLSIADPLKRLQKHGEIYVRFALENPEYYDLMFIMRGPAETIRETKEWGVGLRSYDCLRKNVQDCITAGVFSGVHPDAAAFSLWSHVHGMASLIIRNRCAMFPQEAMQFIVDGAHKFIMDLIRTNAACIPVNAGRKPKTTGKKGGPK